MSEILLATINAKFQHSSFGLRCLLANLGELGEKAVIKEWSLGVRIRDVAEQILEHSPRIVGLSVYIWNVREMTELAALLRALDAKLKIVIGGPEVSFEWEEMPIFHSCDHLVRGEGDLVFAELCRNLLVGSDPGPKALPGGLPPLKELGSPYRHYQDFDIEHGRIVYVEASRGCPFRCAFCLSSLDKSVRSFPLDEFLQEMDSLLQRGVRQFKFVDRTFNLKASTSERILTFFLERYTGGMFLHFEMIPDRLPESLRPIIKQFSPGALQFEVGIQSFDSEVCDRIGRRQNFEAIESNLRFLAEETGVHVHADLIAGLPGEGMLSFGRGFDRLHALGVSEIQVGILKRLRGTPITLLTDDWDMLYAQEPPYEVLRTSVLSFEELQQLQRFARYWDLVANSGRFPTLVKELLRGESAFGQFMGFSKWLYAELGATSGIAARRLETKLREYLGLPVTGRSSGKQKKEGTGLPRRQQRHLSAQESL